MSQQTQVPRAAAYWKKWMARWPTVQARDFHSLSSVFWPPNLLQALCEHMCGKSDPCRAAPFQSTSRCLAARALQLLHLSSGCRIWLKPAWRKSMRSGLDWGTTDGLVTCWKELSTSWSSSVAYSQIPVQSCRKYQVGHACLHFLQPCVKCRAEC